MLNTTPNVSSSMSTTTPAKLNGTPTPIRAISSKLSTRSIPSLPSSTERYEPLVKSLFRQRLQLSLMFSALYAYIVVNVWTLWQAGGLAKVGFLGAIWLPIKPWTICMTLLTWTSLAVPVTVLRKGLLTPNRSTISTPLNIVKTAFSQKCTRIAAVVHFASSISVLFLHAVNEYSYSSEDPKLTLFVKSRKHPHYLNGRLLFLITTQVFTSLVFLFRGVLADRFVYRWAVATSTTQNWTALVVLMSFFVSIVSSALAVAGGMLFFGLARMILPISYNIPLLSMLLRPFTAHFLKGSWSIILLVYHVKLLCRAFFLSFSTFLIWEITENLFDRVISERTTLASVMKDPNTTLVAGTTSTDEVFKFFAYSELRDLATEESPVASSRRTALFGDQKTVPNLWASLCRESLLILGKHYQLLIHRGSLPPPPSAPVPSMAKVTPGPEIGTPAKLLQQPIYKNVKESPGQAALDALASDGPLAQAFEAGADATHIPELFRSVETKVLASPVAEEAKKNVEHVKGLGTKFKDGVSLTVTSFVRLHVPEVVRDQLGQFLEWWRLERLSKKVEASLPFRELDGVVIDVLSYLTCASLTEDRYGVVQKDIPKFLEAMVLMLSAVEGYQAEVDSKFTSPQEQAEMNALAVDEVLKSKKILSQLEDVLKEGIARIVRTFGDRLLAFKFPPPIAQKLQLFLYGTRSQRSRWGKAQMVGVRSTCTEVSSYAFTLPCHLMSTEQESKNPTRLDSQETRVEIEEEDLPVRQLGEARLGTHSIDSDRPFPQFSFNQAARPDSGNYNPAPRRSVINRVPNLKGASSIPGSQPEFAEQFGETRWHCSDPYRYRTPVEGDSWTKCHRLTDKYDEDMCDAWKEEVDKLLIFAGLFSATITAFMIESYRWLHENNDDMSVRLLAFIATQMVNSTVTTTSSVNQIPSEIFLPGQFAVSDAEVRINAAWFLSLTLALSTVLIGIMCLQWLREYRRDVPLSHKEAIALRQMRYEGLMAWRVPQILSALPVILQAALLLFFVGLLDLLWARNKVVAACVSVVVGIVMVFLAVTTALPALQHALVKDRHLRVHQCPYKSPQSWLAYKFFHMVVWFIDSLNFQWANESHRFHRLIKSVSDLDWMTFDMRWRQLRDAEEVVRGTAKKPSDSADIIHGLQWINATFTQSVDAVYPIEKSIADLELSAAATTVSGFYLDGLIDNSTLRVMLDDRFSPTEAQKRDILSAYYLHLHQDRHRVLKPSYLESLLRILNSQDVPRPFYDWLSEILKELASRPNISSDSDSFSILNHEIDVQILLCMKNLMKKSGRSELRTLDLVVAWALLHHLLTPSLLDGSEGRSPGMNVNADHLKLACGMFEEFENWIIRGRPIERCDRVKLCAEGMMTVFPLSVDLVWLGTFCPEMTKAASLVRALEMQMDPLGGPSVVLSKEKKWWLDYWEAYAEKDWSELVENFGRLEL